MSRRCYLLAASVLGYTAGLGLTVLLFQGVLGYDGLTYYVPLATAVLLVSLGSDYNVFVAGRIWTEARTRRLREAVAVATPQAAGAVTVAGITLAASFALLALVPLRSFREFALLMVVGVLIDTLLVRSLLIPGLVSIFGEIQLVARPPRRAAAAPRARRRRRARTAGPTTRPRPTGRTRATLATLAECVSRREARACSRTTCRAPTAATCAGARGRPGAFGAEEFVARVAEREGAAERRGRSTTPGRCSRRSRRSWTRRRWRTLRAELGEDAAPLMDERAGSALRARARRSRTSRRQRADQPVDARGPRSCARTWRSSPQSEPGATKTWLAASRAAIAAPSSSDEEIHANGMAAGAAESGEPASASRADRAPRAPRRGGGRPPRPRLGDRPVAAAAAGAEIPPLGASRATSSGRAERGARAQPGHRVRLGERAHDDEVRAARRRAARRPRRRAELAERLVHDHGRAPAPRAELAERAARDERARRVRRAREHDRGASPPRQRPRGPRHRARAPAAATSSGSGCQPGQREEDVAAARGRARASSSPAPCPSATWSGASP